MGVNNRQKNNLPSEQKVVTKLNFEEKIKETVPTGENEEETSVIHLILGLRDYTKREEVLKELTHKREKFPLLANYLWFSYGTTTIL